MEPDTVVRPPPPAPRTDRLLMVVRRGGEVLARWALPAQALLGRHPSAPMALPVGLGPVRELEVALLPGETCVRLRVDEGTGRGEPRTLHLGEPTRVGRCAVTFFACAEDTGDAGFDRGAPTLALGPGAGDVEQDLLETRLEPLTRQARHRPGGGRWLDLVLVQACGWLLWGVVRIARVRGGWLARRCAARLREEGEELERGGLPAHPAPAS